MKINWALVSVCISLFRFFIDFLFVSFNASCFCCSFLFCQEAQKKFCRGRSTQPNKRGDDGRGITKYYFNYDITPVLTAKRKKKFRCGILFKLRPTTGHKFQGNNRNTTTKEGKKKNERTKRMKQKNKRTNLLSRFLLRLLDHLEKSYRRDNKKQVKKIER